MTRRVALGRICLSLPAGARLDARALADAIGRALVAGPVASCDRLRAVADPPGRGETATAAARRIGRAVAKGGGGAG
jgi:hypothetical protein